MSDVEGIEERLSKIFEENLNVSVPSVDTDLFESGGLDSLVFVELLVCLEKELDVVVEVEDMELENFRSIERIAEFLRHGKSRESTPADDEAAEERNIPSAMNLAR